MVIALTRSQIALLLSLPVTDDRRLDCDLQMLLNFGLATHSGGRYIASSAVQDGDLAYCVRGH